MDGKTKTVAIKSRIKAHNFSRKKNREKIKTFENSNHLLIVAPNLIEIGLIRREQATSHGWGTEGKFSLVRSQ